MANRRVDLTGQKFGRLTVLEMLLVGAGKPSRCLAKCVCGTVKEFDAHEIKRGNTKSCGCLRKEVLDKTVHGLKQHKAYSIWHAMHSRCYNPDNPDYANYGARGIVVYWPWNKENPYGLRNFCYWYDKFNRNDGRSVDRADNDRGYGPSNCRFATAKEQVANSRPRRNKLNG